MPASPPPVTVAVRPNSIAVLPFLNTNPDSADNYLGLGLASELTRVLRGLPGLRVADRSSALSEQSRDPVSWGQRLQVGTILEGTIRRAGERLRVTARLVDVGEGFELWSETYDRGAADLLSVQGEIAQAISTTLHIPGADTTTSLARRPTSSVEAYDAYLAGTYLLNRTGPNDAETAVQHLSQAVRLDSSFALAHAALAEAQMPRYREQLPPRLTLLTAESAALRALQLDSTLARPHRTLGEVRFGYHRDWPGAEAEFRKAIELDPRSPEGYQTYARFLLAMGRRDESLALLERAVELSPLSSAGFEQLGWHHLHARQLDLSRKALAQAIELDSTNWRALYNLALLEQSAANYGRARAYLEQAGRRAPLRLELQVAFARLLAQSGQPDSARAYMQGFQPPFWRVPPYLEACLQSALGERSKAFGSLDRAVAERSELVPFLAIDPRLDPLRADPRFARLIRRLRLPSS
jgi:TolB-like protein/Tfp pilus assembly protein PilF